MGHFGTFGDPGEEFSRSGRGDAEENEPQINADARRLKTAYFETSICVHRRLSAVKSFARLSALKILPTGLTASRSPSVACIPRQFG
jgi:hypothetical protein